MEIKSFADIFKWASTVKFNPVMLVTSPEHYILQQVEKTLENRFFDGEGKDFNYNIVYGSETTGSAVASLSASYPMMAERRIVIVREADKITKEKDELAGYIKSPSQSTFLLLLGTKVNRATLPWNRVPKEFSIDTPAIYDYHVRPWIRDFADQSGFRIDEPTTEFIINTMGTNISYIAAEFEKLHDADIPNKTLTIDLLTKFTGIRKDWNPWELKDALVKSNEEKAQLIAIKMIEAGENPIGILAGLTFSFRSMWLRSYQLAVNKNEPPPKRYPELVEYNLVKEMGSRASRKLEFMIEKLCQLDADLKGFSSLPPQILFSSYISEVCNFEKRDD